MPKNLRDIQSFMDRERLASFVTVGRRNEPHVVPVFFTYNSSRVYVQSDRNSLKVRNLLKNDGVAIAVYGGEQAVIIRGKGRIVGTDEEFVKRTQDHIRKYRLQLDEQGRDSLRIPLFDRNIRCIIEVTPRRTLFW